MWPAMTEMCPAAKIALPVINQRRPHSPQLLQSDGTAAAHAAQLDSIFSENNTIYSFDFTVSQIAIRLVAYIRCIRGTPVSFLNLNAETAR